MHRRVYRRLFSTTSLVLVINVAVCGFVSITSQADNFYRSQALCKPVADLQVSQAAQNLSQEDLETCGVLRTQIGYANNLRDDLKKIQNHLQNTEKSIATKNINGQFSSLEDAMKARDDAASLLTDMRNKYTAVNNEIKKTREKLNSQVQKKVEAEFNQRKGNAQQLVEFELQAAQDNATRASLHSFLEQLARAKADEPNSIPAQPSSVQTPHIAEARENLISLSSANKEIKLAASEAHQTEQALDKDTNKLDASINTLTRSSQTDAVSSGSLNTSSKEGSSNLDYMKLADQGAKTLKSGADLASKLGPKAATTAASTAATLAAAKALDIGKSPTTTQTASQALAANIATTPSTGTPTLAAANLSGNASGSKTAASSLSKDLKNAVLEKLGKSSTTSVSGASSGTLASASDGANASTAAKTSASGASSGTVDKEALAGFNSGGGLGSGSSAIGLAGSDTDASIQSMVNDMLGGILGKDENASSDSGRNLASTGTAVDAEGHMAAPNNQDIGSEESTSLHDRVREAIKRQFAKGNIVYGLRNKI